MRCTLCDCKGHTAYGGGFTCPNRWQKCKICLYTNHEDYFVDEVCKECDDTKPEPYECVLCDKDVSIENSQRIKRGLVCYRCYADTR